MDREVKIEGLKQQDVPEVVDVLRAAFAEYAVMRYVLVDSGGDYDDHLRALVGFFCNKRLVRGWPVLGVRVDGELAGAALISEPGSAPTPPEVERLRVDLAAHIGEAAWQRLEHYERESDLDAPEAPHYFLGVIGVRPENQGQGLARVLLEELAGMSQRDPASTGVCLNTESAGNVAFYEHMGYRVLGHRVIDSLETWCMFRPDD